MAITTKEELRIAVKGGVVAGLVGGLTLGLFVLLVVLWQQGYVWVALKFPSAPFLGERALAPGVDVPAMALGLLVHGAVSIVWGIVFAVLAFGLPRPTTLLAGALFGVLVWIGMFYLVLPILDLSYLAAQVSVSLAVFEHVLFGFAAGAAFVSFQRPVVAHAPSHRYSMG